MADITALTAALGGNREAAQIMIANQGVMATLAKIGTANEKKRLEARFIALKQAERAIAKVAASMRDEPGHVERAEKTSVWDDLETRLKAELSENAAALTALIEEEDRSVAQ